jgi:chromosome segregation ATPase
VLLRNVAALETRIRKFCAAEEAQQCAAEVTKRNYEEVIAICGVLAEEVASSIENWTDIVPEADLKTQIGVITDLSASLEQRESDIAALRTSLEKAHGESKAHQDALRENLRKSEQRLRELNSELLQEQLKLGGLGSIGSVSSGGLGAPFSLSVTSPNPVRLAELSKILGPIGVTPTIKLSDLNSPPKK